MDSTLEVESISINSKVKETDKTSMIREKHTRE